MLGPSVLLNMEGDAHAALRRSLGDLLSPRVVRTLVERSMGERARRLGERLAAGETVDAAAVVEEMVGGVVCTMTGIGEDDAGVRSTFAAVQGVTAQIRLHRPSLTRRQITRARAVFDELGDSSAAAYRAGNPDTIPGRMRELGLTEIEAVHAVAAFVVAGTETAGTFLPRMLALLAGSGWLDALADGRTDVDSGRLIEECFRVTVPSPVMLRAAVTDTEVAGVPVAAGERIVIATLNCCRAAGPFDPSVPLSRDVRHLWFGAGSHFCIGMPLAMAQVDAVLGGVLEAVRARGPVSVVRRRAARNVLFPRYARLELRAGGAT